MKKNNMQVTIKIRCPTTNNKADPESIPPANKIPNQPASKIPSPPGVIAIIYVNCPRGVPKTIKEAGMEI